MARYWKFDVSRASVSENHDGPLGTFSAGRRSYEIPCYAAVEIGNVLQIAAYLRTSIGRHYKNLLQSQQIEVVQVGPSLDTTPFQRDKRPCADGPRQPLSGQ